MPFPICQCFHFRNITLISDLTLHFKIFFLHVRLYSALLQQTIRLNSQYPWMMIWLHFNIHVECTKLAWRKNSSFIPRQSIIFDTKANIFYWNSIIPSKMLWGYINTTISDGNFHWDSECCSIKIFKLHTVN